MSSLGQTCYVLAGKTPEKAAYTNSGDVKIVKFRDVLQSGVVDFTNDEDGWLDTTYSNDSALVDLLPGTILLTNAAHSVEHIGKKVAYVHCIPDLGDRVCFVGELTGIRSKDEPACPTEFVFCWLQSNEAKAAIARAVEGAHLVPRQLKRIKLPDLSPYDRHRITVAIRLADDAVQKARKELEATVELKRSLLNSVFALGLPGQHTAFQETKIGPIPAGWEVRSIRSVLAEKPDSGTSPLSRPDPPGTPILNVACVKNGVCALADVTFVDVESADIERYRTKAGDFFVLRGNGNRDLVATGGLLREDPSVDTIYSDKLIRLRFDASAVVDRFVPYLWQSRMFLTRLQSKAESGSGLWMMSKRDICRELFARPPTDEQSEIVALLDCAEQNMVAHRAKVEALSELKRALLHNLLTGKIRIPEGVLDVRDQ